MNTYPKTIRKLPEAGKEERQKGWEELSAMYRRMQSLELTNVLCERDV